MTTALMLLLCFATTVSTDVVVPGAHDGQDPQHPQHKPQQPSLRSSYRSLSLTDAIEDKFEAGTLPKHEDTMPAPKRTLIINGDDVRSEDRFPWFVHVRGSTPDNAFIQRVCGGSLIAPDLVLTAAHCEDVDYAFVGAYTIRDSGTRYEAVANVRHPNYSHGNLEVNFDIMLTQLAEPVPSSIAVPVKMNWDESFPSQTGYPLWIMGFGSITGGPENVNNRVKPEVLQIAPTEYVSFSECSTATDPNSGHRYGVNEENTQVEPWWFCTLLNDPATTSTCFGDSGGPVFDQQDGTPDGDLLLAVISRGGAYYCGNSHLPLQNNRVSYHKDWIVKTGCHLSKSPPAEWNCNQGGIAPGGPVPSHAWSYATTQRPPAARRPARPTRPPTSRPGATSNQIVTPVEPRPSHDCEPFPRDGVESVPVTLNINLDAHPKETSWYIVDENDPCYRWGIPEGFYTSGTSSVSETILLEKGAQYSFVIQDSNGDGLCCDGDDGQVGSYSLISGETTLASGQGNFGFIEITVFTAPDT